MAASSLGGGPPNGVSSGPIHLKTWMVPLYTPDSLTKYLPTALSTFSGADPPRLSVVVPPQHPGGTDREFLLTNFHRHGCLVRQSLTVGGKRRQLAFCPYCGIINENADTAFSHVRKHLDLLFVCGACNTKSYVNGHALQRHMTYQCISAMAIWPSLSHAGDRAPCEHHKAMGGSRKRGLHTTVSLGVDLAIGGCTSHNRLFTVVLLS